MWPITGKRIRFRSGLTLWGHTKSDCGGGISKDGQLKKFYMAGSENSVMDRSGYSSRRDSRGRYSRDDGRSEMMEHIEMAIDSADERDREKIKRFMRELENV